MTKSFYENDLNHEMESLHTGADGRHQILGGIGEFHRAKPCNEYLRFGQHFLL
jgi:hypothetical protein